MAVTPAERKGYDERLRNVREDAEEREASVIKRKNSEIKNLEKRHREELKAINDEYQSRLDDIQSHNRETITDRDRKHREDMQEMKEVYVGQLRKKMEDGASERRSLEETYRSELAKQKQVSGQQSAHLTEKQLNALQERDEQVGKAIEDARSGMREGLAKNRERMGEAHRKELGAVVQGRDEILLKKERDKNELVKSYEAQLKHEKRQRSESESKWGQKYYDTVQNLSEEHGQSLRAKDELLHEAIVGQRDKYEQRLEQRKAELQEGNEQFQDSVVGRQNAQIRSRDSKIKTLETKLNNEMINDERMRNQQARNLTQAYEARWGDLERQKNESVEVMRDLSDRRVENVVGKNEKLLRETDRQHKSEKQMIVARNREDRANLLEQQKDAVDQVRGSSEKRIERLAKERDKTIRNLADHYDESVEHLKDGYSDKVDKQRETQLVQQNKMQQVLTNRFKDMESKFNNRLEQTVEHYEDKIAQMKENHRKEKMRLEENYKQRLADTGKGHRLEKDSIEQKYEARLAVSEDRHREDMERLNRQHQEEVKTVASRYSRKG